MFLFVHSLLHTAVCRCIAAGGQAWGQSGSRESPQTINRHGTIDLTRGVRFDGHLSAIAQHPRIPTDSIWVRAKGAFISRDGGLSWEETNIHTHKRPFVGALRGFEVLTNTLTRPLGITLLSRSRLNHPIAESPI